MQSYLCGTWLDCKRHQSASLRDHLCRAIVYGERAGTWLDPTRDTDGIFELLGCGDSRRQGITERIQGVNIHSNFVIWK